MNMNTQKFQCKNSIGIVIFNFKSFEHAIPFPYPCVATIGSEIRQIGGNPHIMYGNTVSSNLKSKLNWLTSLSDLYLQCMRTSVLQQQKISLTVLYSVQQAPVTVSFSYLHTNLGFLPLALVMMPMIISDF